MSHRKHGNRPQPIPVPEALGIPEKAEKKQSLLDVVKKIFVWVKPLDFVILIVGGIMISRVDFSSVTLVDVIYMTTFLMWFLFLLARIYFTRLNRIVGGKGD
ncbi:MAG: hypothetical protein J6N99_10580 [Schwartzia sp.]|nr:hypothetical protein [Schwartzia sp. (in: firmicutes)]MBO6211119.1 hypothetical protein [Schwartzia sp. (in: firmicutes)]MBP3691054.1 hypothetical protein [Schwartzia sp. (in: firmicutes)]